MCTADMSKLGGVPLTNDDDGGLIVFMDDQAHRPLQ